jgi:site-specific recombinase XerD
MTNNPSAATLHAYTGDWRDWCSWCDPRGIDPLRCTVAELTRCLREWRAAGRSYSTVGRRKAAIGYFQRQAGVEHPAAGDRTMHAVMAEIHRSAPAPRGKFPISHADLTRIYADCDADPKRLRGLRDRAIFVVGWSSCMDRAALAALRVADLSTGRLKLSTDGRRMVIEWLQAAQIRDGRLFRSVTLGQQIGDAITANNISRAVKRRCAAIGKAEAQFSARSLRNGRIAHEVRRGTAVREIMHLAGVVGICRAHLRPRL